MRITRVLMYLSSKEYFFSNEWYDNQDKNFTSCLFTLPYEVKPRHEIPLGICQTHDHLRILHKDLKEIPHPDQRYSPFQNNCAVRLFCRESHRLKIIPLYNGPLEFCLKELNERVLGDKVYKYVQEHPMVIPANDGITVYHGDHLVASIIDARAFNDPSISIAHVLAEILGRIFFMNVVKR